jgi:Rad3-related DNA helicase
MDKDFFVIPEYPENVQKLLENIMFLIEKQLDKKNKAFHKFYMIKIYFQVLFIVNSIKGITPNHVIYFQRNYTSAHILPDNEQQYLLKVFCINPRELLAEFLKLAKSSIFFSATLHPFDYFCEIFAEKDGDKRLTLLSPFEKEKFGLYIYTGVNTMYKYRDSSFEPISELIDKVCSAKKGNYLIYFPSFSFMHKVYEILKTKGLYEHIVCQKSKMSEKERIEFLKRFDEQDTHLVAFAVLGGIFAEGIDLIGTKLIGSMIISVGLPGLGGEKDLIKDYYDNANHQGFDFAYRYPGFNKIMQAAGRVIRSEEDKGIVILVDHRFSSLQYKELYPPDWSHYQIFSGAESLVAEVKRFWVK